MSGNVVGIASTSVSPASARQRRRKTLNACVQCRSRKLRCSGHNPCERCVATHVSCVFEEKERRVVVSQTYLNSLRSTLRSEPQANAIEDNGVTNRRPETTIDTNGQATPQTDFSVREDPQARPLQDSTPIQAGLQDLDHSIANDLISSGPQLRVRGNGQHRYLGDSSTLSFSRRVRNMIQSCKKLSGSDDATPSTEDITYSIQWPTVRLKLDDIDLPSLDFAEYLTSTVTFYAGPLYCLYDKASFLERLRAFYAKISSGSYEQPSLWHIQMLLVFALGRAILAREHFKNGPAGTTYFLRAVEALPDPHQLHEQPILSVEVLCLLTMFMQAVDAGKEAYTYIGLALRIAVAHGLNRSHDTANAEDPHSRHRARLWWTVYIIDRRASALMGTPPGIRNEDIFQPEPPIHGSSETDYAFAMHVAVSQHLGNVLDIIYGTKNQGRGRFIEGVQTILTNLAETSTFLTERLPIETQRPVDTLSRVAATLHILSHQCIILAVRPVLFSLLSLKLTSTTPLHLSDPINALLRMCVESAFNVLKIIFALKSQNMSDLFLPYDLDAIFSAAFALILVDIIVPATDLLWDLQRVFSYIDEFITREFMSAHTLKADLQDLLDLHTRLQATETHSVYENTGTPPASGSTTQHHNQHDDIPDQDMVWSWMMDDDGDLRGLHPDTIQSAIDGLNVGSMDLPEFSMNHDYNIWGAHST